MKPKEISSKDYDKIKNALEKKAEELATKIEAEAGSMSFFSSWHQTCYYDHRKKPKSFRIFCNENTSYIRHFLPFPCDCKRASMYSQHDITEWAICLADINDKKGRRHFYLTVHRIGRCPWKEAKRYETET